MAGDRGEIEMKYNAYALNFCYKILYNKSLLKSNFQSFTEIIHSLHNQGSFGFKGLVLAFSTG